MSKRKETVSKYTYKTRFGSTSDMIVKDLGDTVECEDEHGKYLTQKNRIDNGLSDPNRCATSRLIKLFQGKKENEEKGKR